jgi:DNA-binding PadR family transcriptional regulator
MQAPRAAIKPMALHHAILSQLAGGESYGYELKRAFDRSVGPHWGALNVGHLYQVLDRLKRDGLVEILRAEPQPRRPERLIYAITPAGREELSRWLQTPSAPAVGYRDDLYLKLVAAARGGRAQLTDVVRRERHAHLAELHALRSLPDTETPDALAALLTEGAALLVEARLRLLELADHDSAHIVSAAATRGTATQAARSRGAA